MTEKMKPSGITWIGDIPSDWQVKRLKYACQKITDGSHFSPETVDEGKVYITVSDLHGDTIHTDTAKRIAPSDFAELVKNGCQPNPGDVLLSKDGTVGRSAIVNSNNDYVVLSSIGILTPGTMLLSNYLKYNLDGSHLQEQMLRAMDGSALKRITISKIAEFFAVIPPIEEQNAIADFLDNQCAKINSVITDIEKQIETLHKYKKSLITETVTKGLDRSAPMKDSGIAWIGEIPCHWDLKRLKFMLENSSDSMKVGPFGSALFGSDFTDEGKWVYNQRVVLDQNFSENTTFISEEKFREMRGFAVYPGDILITTRGTIGKVAIVPKGAAEGILHPCTIKFRVDKEMMIPELLQIIFNESDFVKDQFTLMSNATTIEVIYSYSLKDIILPVIPADEQKQIYNYLSDKCATIDSVLAQKKKQLSAIQQHKKSLIYEYVTGKKRVMEVN